MLEKIIKKDKNEELEKVLEEKMIDEQAKNLLQGILYKIEVSYKDYKKVVLFKTCKVKFTSSKFFLLFVLKCVILALFLNLPLW